MNNSKSSRKNAAAKGNQDANKSSLQEPLLSGSEFGHFKDNKVDDSNFTTSVYLNESSMNGSVFQNQEPKADAPVTIGGPSEALVTDERPQE